MTENFTGRLRALNLKATPQRLAILDIMQRAQTFLAPDELQERLLRQCGRVGLPTIYRNLEELAHKGVLTKIIHPNRQLYYYFCANPTHHHHFVCLECRTVADIDHCSFAEMAQHVDGEVSSHIVQLLGRCRSCLQQEQGAQQ